MNDLTLPGLAGLTSGDALLLDAEATLKRAQAEIQDAPLARAKLLSEADALDALATRLRDPSAFGLPELQLGQGGEISPLPQPSMPLALRDVAETVHSRPVVLGAEASMSRLTLAREAGVLTEAVEAAESVGTESALEQMLVHEVTAAHRIAMRLLAAADRAIQNYEGAHGQNGTALAQAARSSTAAARLTDSITRATASLDRMHNGGRQQVTVQHVNVGHGGQAVVANNLEAGGRDSAAVGWTPRRGRGPGRARDPMQ